MLNGTKVAVKWNRCVEFTFADGTVIVCKVQGEKVDAVKNAKTLVDKLSK